MNIIIVGAGKIGSYLTSQLAELNHNLLVIEKDKDVLNRLLAANDVMGIIGDGTDFSVLDEADVNECDVFIALAQDDDTNIIASVMAKNLGAKYAIARVRDPKYLNNFKFMRQSLGIDNFVNPDFYAAKEIQRTLKYPHAHSVESFLRGKVNMIQLEIKKGSHLINKSLQQLDNEGYLKDSLICIAGLNGKIFIPNGDHILREGEKIHIAGSSDSLLSIYKSEINSNDSISNVMIVGASRIGYYLIELLLERNFNVTVLERNKEKAIAVSEAFPEAVVINSDGSDPEVLEEERINTFDAIIALTNFDQENILISLAASKLGVNKTMTKVDNIKLLRLTGILDIDSTITSKRSASDFVSRMVRSKENANGFSIKNLFRLEDEKVEAIEFNVIENSRVVDKKLKDLKFKDNTLVAYIQDGPYGNVEVAKGNSTIKLGDRVLVITTYKNFSEIDDILE